LIVFTGQSTVLRDGAIFEEHLRYWWMIDMRQRSQRLPGKFVLCEWKPVLRFAKNYRHGWTLCRTCCGR
jgi:hypothetical protein